MDEKIEGLSYVEAVKRYVNTENNGERVVDCHDWQYWIQDGRPMTPERPKIDRNYYSSDEFKTKLERSAEAVANDTEYQKDLAYWNGAMITMQRCIFIVASFLLLTLSNR